MWRETTFVKHFHGILKRRYSVSSGARKRSFLFDEPPGRNDKQPDFTTNREGTPSVEGNIVEGKDASIDRNSLQDPYAQMVASPIRRCAITGAKLPKDFLIRLRQVSVDVPVTKHGKSSPHYTLTHAANSTPTVRKTYLVPSGLILEPEEVKRSAKDSGSMDGPKKVGKSKYILCRAETFGGLGKKKDRKSLGSDIEMSTAIVDQIAFQLQSRVVQEIQRLCCVRSACLSQTAQKPSTNINRLQPLWPKDLESLRSGLPLLRFGKRSVYAILDLGISAASSKSSDGTAAPSHPSYSDMPLLYPPSGPSDTVAAPIPVFKIEHMFPSDMYETINLAMQTCLATGSSTEPVGSFALCLTEGSDPGHILPPADLKHIQDGTRLFIALWRLRLWFGHGWTVPGPVNSAIQGAEEEQSRGCIVQGFKSIQGVFHKKWP